MSFKIGRKPKLTTLLKVSPVVIQCDRIRQVWGAGREKVLEQTFSGSPWKGPESIRVTHRV